MTKITASLSRVTYGLDLGDRFSHYFALDEAGAVLGEGRLPTTRTALLKHFERLEPCLISLETGTHSPWISRLLEGCGHEVIIANPRKLSLITRNQRKNDRNDAELLSRLARADPALLHPIRHRGEKAQRDLAVLRARAGLIRSRTALINHARGVAKSLGGRLPASSSSTFPAKALESLPEDQHPGLKPLLVQIGCLNDSIKEYDRQVKTLTQERYPETARLLQVVGVGPLTALTFVLTLEDPQRFTKSRMVGAFLGLVPRQAESGKRSPELRITKAGDRELRRLLTQCAHYILGPFGPDSDLRRYGQRIAETGKKSAKKRSITAVARKLAVLLHSLWRSGESYEPIRYPDQRAEEVAMV